MDKKRLIILGAGPGGYVAAIRAAQLGVDVTIVEDREVGGTCLHRGCIPTKAIISSVELLDKIRKSGEHGITISGEVEFSVAGMIARKNKLVGNLTKGIGALFKSHGVTLLLGRGVITGKHSVEVTLGDGSKSEIEGDGILIATGSSPFKIPIFPFDGKRVITSDDAVNMTYVPEDILIVGAGVIGAEFAFIYNALGSNVTMVEMLPRSIATEDSEISSILQREMRKKKIELLVSTRVEKVELAQDKVKVSLDNGKVLAVGQVLVSVGRSYNSKGIGLESMGIKTNERGCIAVNDKMETNIDGIYAIGDVIGGIMLAHVASAEGKVAVENFAGTEKRMDYSVVPAGIFTSPEIGSVGITSDAAEEKGIPVKISRFSFKGLGKAHALGETQGIVKLIGDPDTKKILGAHIIGPHATDLIHEAALAMHAGISCEEIAETIHAHPTLAEGVLEAAEDMLDMAIHAPRKK